MNSPGPASRKRSKAKSSQSRHPTPDPPNSAGLKWMKRKDALDLLVQTACRMHWTVPPPPPLENGDNPESDEHTSAAIDPLLFQADVAIELISRCEMLLEKRQAEPHLQAQLLNETKRAFGSSSEAEKNFKMDLQKRVGEPLGKDGRFSHAQVRLILTGHEAAKRGDGPLKDIWAATRSIPWVPKTFDSLGEDEFSEAVDRHVRDEGLTAWQLQMLTPFATKLGKKNLSPN